MDEVTINIFEPTTEDVFLRKDIDQEVDANTNWVGSLTASEATESNEVTVLSQVNDIAESYVRDHNDLDGLNLDDYQHMTEVDMAKFDGIEENATRDQEGYEIVALIDTELNSTDWRYGGMSSIEIIEEINKELGTDWQTQKQDPTGTEIIDLLDTQFGNEDWRTQIPQLTDVEVIALIDGSIGTDWKATLTNQEVLDIINANVVNSIDSILGNSDWQTQIPKPTDSEIVASINNELGSTDWQTQIPQPTPNEIVDSIDSVLGTDWKTQNEDLTATEIISLLDTQFGDTNWRTQIPHLTDTEVVEAVNNALGNTDWQNKLTEEDVVEIVRGNVATHNELYGLNLDDYQHLTEIEKAKFDGIEENATRDQEGFEIVAIIDTELGSPAWRDGSMTSTEIIEEINTELGTDWQQNTPPLTGSETIDLLDTQFGDTNWRTQIPQLTQQEVIDYVNSYVGNTSWQSQITPAEIILAINSELGSFLWQTQLEGDEIVDKIDAEIGIGWRVGSGGDITGEEIESLMDAYFGDTVWKTHAEGSSVVDSIDTELGNEDWKVQKTASQIVTDINTELGNEDWQTAPPSSVQGSDLLPTDYLMLTDTENIYFIDGVGNISGVNKEGFEKGKRITLIPKSGSTLKHFQTGSTNEIPFWFWSREDTEITTDYFAIDFELLELSQSVKDALGISSNYIWGAIETGLTGNAILKDIYIELGEAYAYTVDETTEITGFPVIEATYTIEHKGTANAMLDNINNKITFDVAGTYYGCKISNDLGEIIYEIPAQEAPRDTVTELPVLTTESIWDVEGKNELAITDWTGLAKVTDYFHNHHFGITNSKFGSLVYNSPICKDGDFFIGDYPIVDNGSDSVAIIGTTLNLKKKVHRYNNSAIKYESVDVEWETGSLSVAMDISKGAFEDVDVLIPVPDIPSLNILINIGYNNELYSYTPIESQILTINVTNYTTDVFSITYSGININGVFSDDNSHFSFESGTSKTKTFPANGVYSLVVYGDLANVIKIVSTSGLLIDDFPVGNIPNVVDLQLQENNIETISGIDGKSFTYLTVNDNSIIQDMSITVSTLLATYNNTNVNLILGNSGGGNTTLSISDSGMNNIQFNGGNYSNLDLKNNNLISLDLSSATITDGTIGSFQNNQITSFVEPSSGRFLEVRLENNNLSGELIVGAASTFWKLFTSGNAGLTQITSTSNLDIYNFLSEDTSLGSPINTINNWSNLRYSCGLSNNSMTTSEVNEVLVQLDTYPNISGSPLISLAGNNASPDSTSGGFDGLAAKASLISKGANVSTN